MHRRLNELAALMLTSFAALLFQITVTKIFDFSLWSNYAYLVISTAMFGLGLSGVILTRWPSLLQARDSAFLTVCAVLSGLTMFGAFLVLNCVPIHLPYAPDGWPRELVRVGVVFVALAVPFAFFGFIISFLMARRGERANVYYFADLVGAGLGSFALVWLIPQIGPEGLVALCSLLSIGAAALFFLSSDARPAVRWAVVLAVFAAIACAVPVWTPRMSKLIPVKAHLPKRTFANDLKNGRIEATKWSALSRVDIAPLSPGRKRVWIAGGVNESSIVKFDGDFGKLAAGRDAVLDNAARILDHKALPHLSKTNHTVCMIGTSGGEDSLYALMLGARHVTGVEMDPAIAKFVTEDYGKYAGGLFTDGRYSDLVIDEGRSYLRRSDKKFDVIQQINSFTPIAFQNGALNLSETYLLTVESFRDFYDHLTDDGILAISRYGTIRLLSVAVEMFRRMGMKPGEYSRRLVVCEGSQWIINSFMMKKSPFTPEEIDTLFEFMSHNRHRSVLYAPYRTNDVLNAGDNLYCKIATAEDPSRYYRMGCFDFSPSTDGRPFFNRMKVLGMKDTEREKIPHLPGEVMNIESPGVLGGRIPQGDVPPLVMLLEAFVLASLFFGLPMLSKRQLRETLTRHSRALGYFACIGVAFIFIEICLMQRMVLFLGAPVYSIAAVLCGLLIAAGLGSLVSGRIAPTIRNIRFLLGLVAVSVVVIHLLMPSLTRLFLGSSFPTRLGVSLAITGAAGFLMGMPMPTGIRFLKAAGKPVIPWAWAVNGYFSVVGSALSVVVAMSYGFMAAFALATALYLAAPLFLRE